MLLRLITIYYWALLSGISIGSSGSSSRPAITTTHAFSAVPRAKPNRINKRAKPTTTKVSTPEATHQESSIIVNHKPNSKSTSKLANVRQKNNIIHKNPRRLQPGETAPVQLSDGTTIGKYAYRQGIPPSLTKTLQEFLENDGGGGTSIHEMFRVLLTKQSLEPGETLKLNCGGSSNSSSSSGNDNGIGAWNVQRPRSHWSNNMHWIAPADKKAQEAYRNALKIGGFDTAVLENIGKTFGLEHVDVHHVFFVGVSHAEESYTHVDYDDTDGRGFTILFPLHLPSVVPSSPDGISTMQGAQQSHSQSQTRPAELGFQNDAREWYGWYKYEENEAALVGDGTWHVTADCDYRDTDDYRICANIYVCDKSHPINGATNAKGVYVNDDDDVEDCDHIE